MNVSLNENGRFSRNGQFLSKFVILKIITSTASMSAACMLVPPPADNLEMNPLASSTLYGDALTNLVLHGDVA